VLSKEHNMPMDVALAVFLIATPFVVFALALAYADNKTKARARK
jgi:hypothetical protein